MSVIAERWEVNPQVMATVADRLGVPPESLGSIRLILAEFGDHSEPQAIERQVRLLRDAGAALGVLSDADRSWLFGFAASLNGFAGGTPLVGLTQAMEFCYLARELRGQSVAQLSGMSSDELREMMAGIRELYPDHHPVGLPHHAQSVGSTNLILRNVITQSLDVTMKTTFEDHSEGVRAIVETSWQHEGRTIEDLADLAHRIGTTDLRALLGFSDWIGSFPDELPDLALELEVPADYMLRVASGLNLHDPNHLRVLREDLRRLHGQLSPEDFNVDLRARMSAMGLKLGDVARFMDLAAMLGFHSEEFQDLSNYLRDREGMSLKRLTDLGFSGATGFSKAESMVKDWRTARAKIPGDILGQELFAALNPEAPGRP
jgi:hypothetical protein